MKMSYWFVFFALFSLICSCASQNKPQEKKQAAFESLVEPKQAHAKRLKFTTGVRCILEDTKGNTWFGSYQEGACKYDGKEFTYYTVDDGLSGNQVRTIYEDEAGTIWFECGVGLSSFDGVRIKSDHEKKFKFLNVWKSTESDLWFKGEESTGYNQKEGLPGVYRWDGEQLTYLTFPLAAKDDRFALYSISTPFAKGRNGQFWFGTYSAVFGFDGLLVSKIDDASLGLNELSGRLHVRSLYEDSKGRLWIGNNGIGVLLKKGDEVYNFSEAMNLISITSGRSGGYRSVPGTMEHVFSIGEDSAGNIWFGDRDTGAWKYDGKTMKNYGIDDGLTATHIWQIYETKSGKLWFAMADGAVCEYRGGSFMQVF